VRTYIKVSVRDEHLTVENIRSGTCEAPNAAVELGRVSWCGPDDGASEALPVGSVQDQVVIHKSEKPGGGPRKKAVEPVTTQQGTTTITTLN